MKIWSRGEDWRAKGFKFFNIGKKKDQESKRERSSYSIIGFLFITALFYLIEGGPSTRSDKERKKGWQKEGKIKRLIKKSQLISKQPLHQTQPGQVLHRLGKSKAFIVFWFPVSTSCRWGTGETPFSPNKTRNNNEAYSHAWKWRWIIWQILQMNPDIQNLHIWPVWVHVHILNLLISLKHLLFHHCQFSPLYCSLWTNTTHIIL